MLDQPLLVTMGYWESLPNQQWVSVRGVQDQLGVSSDHRPGWLDHRARRKCVEVGGWSEVWGWEGDCTLWITLHSVHWPQTTLNKHSCRSVGWELRDHTWSQLLHRCQLNSQSCNWMSWYSFNISVPPTVTMVTCSQTVTAVHQRTPVRHDIQVHTW